MIHSDTTLEGRRKFMTRSLVVGGGVLAIGSAGCASDDALPEASSALPDGKDAADFLIHSPHPLAMETRRGVFGSSVVVPNELVYVRNNLPFPDASIVADPNAWKVDVGGVTKPRSVTVGQLKTMGMETVAMVLQCSGNGRAFFDHEVSGSPWGVGAAACVIWSGVLVRDLIQALGGAAAGMNYLTATGGEDLPPDIDPDRVRVERSIPIEKALDDTILAWEMNGEPIPLANGGPLRLIVPGYFGVNQVKYVNRVALTLEVSTARIMQTSYRLRAVGESGASSQPTMWPMSVKSWINTPSGQKSLTAGSHVIHGVAFGGMKSVSSVEVSLDGGGSWQAAPLVGPDLGRYAWRQFALRVDLAAGAHTLASRAVDVDGVSQPELRTDNERGYGSTSWRDHAVAITVA